MAIRHPIAIVGLAAALFIQDQAMALGKTLYLFSAVEGTVVLGGKPVQGAVVQQQYAWGDVAGSNKAVTDELGRYAFPPVTRESLLALLPHQPNVKQYLFIEHAGIEHQGWFHGRRNYDDQGEIGRPLRLVCDLQDSAGPKPSIRSFGICNVVEPK